MADIFGSGNRKDKWVKKATEWINYLFNHKSDTLVAGQNITLTPDSTNHTVTIDSTASGGASSLADLTDTDIDNPTDGQALVYDDGEWVNAPLPSAPVTDVEVDGTSVVNASGVAEIDLTDYAKSADIGTAAAKDYTTSVTQNSADLVTSGAVWTAIDNLPEPMIFKGTLGTGGTITTLPTASASNEGYTYKVITAGTYAGQGAKVGDVFVSNCSEWVLIPAGDTDSDTWRAIKVNGTQLLGSAISTGAVNFKSGTNAQVSGNGNDISVDVSTTFTEASTRSNIASGETLATIFGKIKKFFTDLKAVAFSGSYNDLSDQPTIPTVGNGTITLQKNGTTVDTFTVNQSANKTINMTLAKGDVGLGNADNTSDANKNVNSATKLTKTETVLQTNQVPYVSRASLNPEGFSGYIREMLVGGSVGWNQMIYNGNFVDTSKWVFASSSTVSASNNVLTMTANTAGSLLSAYPDTAYRNTWQVGHKILATLDAKTSTSGLAISASLAYGTVTKNKIKINFSLTSSWQTISNIVNITEATEGIRIAHANSSAVAVGDAYQVRNVYAVDLTILFGSVIADYIYNLESSTAGAGVSLLRSLGFFTEPYYAQDSGSIQSVCVNSKKITGFNQWDEVWELGGISGVDGSNMDSYTDRIRSKNYIPAIPNQSYYLCYLDSRTATFFVAYYDGNKNFIERISTSKNTSITTPNDCYYMRFFLYSRFGVTTYNNDICINISDTSKNGTYETYHLDTIPLSSTDLHGIPKLDSNNNLYYDGDEYESSGKITRKYGIVDLGTLTWLYNSTYKVFYCSDDLGEARKTGVTTICSKYLAVANTTDISTIQNGTCCVYSNSGVNVHRLYVKDEMYTTTSAFKTAMSGVYFVYELATPTEETVSAYQNPQYAKDGTEEFVDGITRDMIVPVGHVTEYMGTTTDEYQVMPTMPVDDGKYVLTADKHEVVWERKGWKFYKQAFSDMNIDNFILLNADEIMLIAHWGKAGVIAYSDTKIVPVSYLLESVYFFSAMGFYGNENTHYFVEIEGYFNADNNNSDITFYGWTINGSVISDAYFRLYYR